ncbi:uncharacterized protein LOC143459161 isoform X1 [Clavelina lepadiformis]|uniref:uncharacterized protein LOC143459161 isoform X1 n=2 Tax=Clavelina lepadiformis TaxID=159417 RepID=UPI004041EBBE
MDIASVKKDFTTPTNQASITNYRGNFFNPKKQEYDAKCLHVSSNLTAFATNVHSPWNPVSKGDIKKLAQTRFVNSSPKSYRLMPASVESSNADKTSFVEKASHKYLLPVSYFLEVANLWALSNRSELECRFTFANTEDDQNSIMSAQNVLVVDKRRPICHTQAIPAKTESERDILKNNAVAENELLQSVNRFLETCQKKDKSSIGKSTELSEADNGVGSETRRYLSQIVSLTNKKFAIKLQNGLSRAQKSNSSRKRSSSTEEDFPCKKSKNSPRVNVFTMSTMEKDETEKDQFVIIHIPTSQKKTSEETQAQGKPSESQRKSSTEGILDTINSDSSSIKMLYNCFYCESSFEDKSACARHMLSHLASSIDS